MTDKVAVITQVYKDFNLRHIDAVLQVLTKDVMWANAMDGGYAHGHDGIREYWTRQWSIVDPHVDPMGFRTNPDGAIIVEVMQTIRDLDGNILQEQTHGLKDKTVEHIFHFQDELISRFDVQDSP